MADINKATAASETLFVARQPIFTAEENIWGYELLFRSCQENMAVISDEAQATSSVIVDGLALASEGMNPDAKILINFPERLLIEDVGFVLPPDRCVIEILEHVPATEQTLAAARRLKEAGYTLALDDYTSQPELKPFLEFTDILKLDILNLDCDLDRIEAALADIPSTCKTLAEKVEDIDVFNALKKMNFTFYQGFFFSHPEIVPGKKLSASETTKLQILSELSKSEVEPARLDKILRSDPSLAYRLLRYINAAGWGLQEKVSSVKRAIDMMGMEQAKQWLRSMILCDFNISPKTGELAYLAVHRAKFLESICANASHGACVPDSLFMVGLFSLLDAMLGIEMDEILKMLPLDNEVIKALKGEGRMAIFLDIVSSYEHGVDDEAAKQLQDVGLNAEQVELLYVRSRNWTQKVLGYSR